MKQKTLIIFGALFLLTAPTLATEKNSTDIFIPIKKEIQTFSSFVDSGHELLACKNLFGKNIIMDYDALKTIENTLRDSKENIEGSPSYLENTKEIDEEIFRIVEKFSINSLACEEKQYLIAKKYLQDISLLRNELFKNAQADRNIANQNKQENDKTHKKSVILSETQRLMQNFFTKISLIQKTFTNLEYKDISDEYPWKLSSQERERIQERARNRAESYAEEFVYVGQQYLFGDIYRSTTDIKKNLGSLPDRRSKSENFTYSHDFYDIFSEMAKDNIQQKVQKNTTILENKRDEFYTTNIDISKTIEKENKEYLTKLQQLMPMEDKLYNFDKRFSSAVIDSFYPFHTSLQETEKLFNYNTQNLKYVLNRQNVEVE